MLLWSVQPALGWLQQRPPLSETCSPVHLLLLLLLKVVHGTWMLTTQLQHKSMCPLDRSFLRTLSSKMLAALLVIHLDVGLAERAWDLDIIGWGLPIKAACLLQEWNA